MKYLQLFEQYIAPQQPPTFKIGDITDIGLITNMTPLNVCINGKIWIPALILQYGKAKEWCLENNIKIPEYKPKMPKEVKSPKSVHKVILSFVKSFMREYEVSSAYDVNNGYCVEFADELIDKLEVYGGDCRLLTTFDLKDNNEHIDNEFISSVGSPLPAGIDINYFPEGGHDWVYFNGKHYDAECPQGVNSLFELPIFARVVNKVRTGEWLIDASQIKVY